MTPELRAALAEAYSRWLDETADREELVDAIAPIIDAAILEADSTAFGYERGFVDGEKAALLAAADDLERVLHPYLTDLCKPEGIVAWLRARANEGTSE